MLSKDLVYESIDRLTSVEVRLTFLVRNTIPKLYEAARGYGAPISRQMAEAIMACLDKGQNRFFIVSGFYDPKFLPVGESDGLYGAAALAKTLTKLGAQVTCGVERECVDATKALVQAIGCNCAVVPLVKGKDSKDANAEFEKDYDAAVFIEKCGPSPFGVYHFATETPRDPEHESDMGKFLDKMKVAGKTTFGFGDYGNEIGFGKIYKEAVEITGRHCKCPYNEGIVSCYATDYFLPCCVSNIGVYALISALALLTGNLDILHTSEDEKILLDVGMENGVYEGTYMRPMNDSVDGVPLAALCGYIEILKAIPTRYHEGVQGRGV